MQMTAAGGEQSRVRMAHYKGTIVVVKLLSRKGAAFTHLDELEMTAVSLAWPKLHGSSFLVASS